MTIQQDLDILINRPGSISDLEKSQVAYSILLRFEQVRDAISGGKNLELLACADFIPPALRSIVAEYKERSIGMNQALHDLDIMERQADIYLRHNGYDPDSAKANDEKFQRIAEENMASLGKLYTELKDLEQRMKSP